jgi:hypothetical protein
LLNSLVLLFDLEVLVDPGSLDHLVALEHMMRMLDLVSPGDLEFKKKDDMHLIVREKK